MSMISPEQMGILYNAYLSDPVPRDSFVDWLYDFAMWRIDQLERTLTAVTTVNTERIAELESRCRFLLGCLEDIAK